MIRPARPDDFARIDEITRAAFEGGAEEVGIIHAARAEGSVVWETVAETDGRVMGHILFTRMSTDRPLFFAAIGPVGVDPAVQKCGLGSALILDGLSACKTLGVDAVVLLGHRTYYPRFGFSAEAARVIASPYGGSPSFMALALTPGALDRPLRADYPPAFGPPPEPGSH
jgi:putative acetyltransferase